MIELIWKQEPGQPDQWRGYLPQSPACCLAVIQAAPGGGWLAYSPGHDDDEDNMPIEQLDAAKRSAAAALMRLRERLGRECVKEEGGRES